MALIYCFNCGKQISDKAAACPHCGAARTPVNTVGTAAPAQPQMPVQQAPAKKGNGAQIALIVTVIVLALALVGVVLFFVLGGNNTSQGNTNTGTSSDYVYELVPPDNYAPPVEYVPPTESTAPSQSTAPAAPQTAMYDVELKVQCKQNIAANKYDIDILIDGRNLSTLPHGQSETHRLTLAEGSHTIEFRLASKDIWGEPLYDPQDEGSYQKVTLNVSGDMTAGYLVNIAWGNTVKVTRE